MQRGQPQAALPVAEAWVEREPGNAQAWVQLGQVLIALQHDSAAIRVMEKALLLNPSHDQVWLHAAHLLLQTQLRQGILDAAQQTLAQTEAKLKSHANMVAPAWLEYNQWQLASCWWQPHEARRVRLRRLHLKDANWLKASFANNSFANAVNREYAKRIIQTTEAVLAQQLDQQLKQPPASQGAVLWLIERFEGEQSETLGLASFVNIDAHSRRAEFIIGFPGDTVPGAVVMEASVLLADVVFNQIGLHKVMAHIYGDNPRRDALTEILLRLGFQSEGVLRQQVRVDSQYVDLHQLGALRHEILAHKGFQRLVSRYLGRTLKPAL